MTSSKNAAIKWNAHQYNLLTEHGEPDLSELAQHLAQAFNLKPPKGYAAVHRWKKRALFTRSVGQSVGPCVIGGLLSGLLGDWVLTELLHGIITWFVFRVHSLLFYFKE